MDRLAFPAPAERAQVVVALVRMRQVEQRRCECFHRVILSRQRNPSPPLSGGTVTHEESEAILAKIDEAIGKPEDETPDEHEHRVEWVTRESLRRRLARVIAKK